jgi:ABC-type lipoprotein release transport system permease subunit
MQLYLRLAWRNIWRHRRRTFIVVVALALGLMLMMFYDGMIAGFEQAIYGNAIKVLGGNIRIHAAGYAASANSFPLIPLANDQDMVQAAQSIPNVVSATRRINTGGLVSNREGAFSVSIVGLEPEQEAPNSVIAQHIADGRFLVGTDQDQILIGRGLADLMSVQLGDRITLVGRSTHEQMRQRTMTVVGIYDIGVPALEQQTVYISLLEAQALYDLSGESTEVMITLQKVGQEPAVMAALTPYLQGDEIQSWAQAFPDLENTVNAKNGAMTIFSVIMLMIAGIGVINLLLMAVFERTREIGLLGAMGMKPGQIRNLFVLEGVMLGLVGVAAGLVMGIGLNGLLGIVGIDYSQFTSLTSYTALITGRVYPTLALGSVFSRGLPVLVIAILAALYPAHEASRQEPAEALHYV